MTEQQENKDWLDKLIEFFKNPNKDIAYSIRKRGEDEIEIRDSLFDGYARGFIRFVLFAGFLIIGFGGGNSLTKPFVSQINDFKVTFARAYNPDERIMPVYKDYLEMYNTPGTLTSQEPLISYEEYSKPYLDDWKYEKVRIYSYGVFFAFILFLFFLPRPRGFRVNRKKRVIYWQTILGSHSIAFVPDSGDPLGGINYSRFGLYAFGEHERFSLQLWINDYFTKRRATAWFG
ncbi:hypothetical protein P7M32_10890, partial [Bisgaard Taxon 10/6]|nr:hypothetical protein [Exercitatus varius]MDG2946922.1 hypothetical protein [Exercitatus varius]